MIDYQAFLSGAVIENISRYFTGLQNRKKSLGSGLIKYKR